MPPRRKQSCPRRKTGAGGVDDKGLPFPDSGEPADLAGAADAAADLDTTGGEDMDADLESLQLSQEHLLYHDQDLLTCGECRCEFALADIVKFIRHKAKECRSGQCDDDEFDEELRNGDDETDPVKASDDSPDSALDGGDNDADQSVRKQKPSIIAQHHKLKLLKQQARALQLASQQRHRHAALRRLAVHTVDVGINTISSEPAAIICTLCKQAYASPWYLLQHAQNVHGTKIMDEMPADGQLITGGHSLSLLSRLPLDRTNAFIGTAVRGPAGTTSHPGADGLYSGGLFGEPPLMMEPARGSTPAGRPTSAGQQPSAGLLGPVDGQTVDFYSQRLRQLAGATSPRPLSPTSRKLTPPNSTSNALSSLSSSTGAGGVASSTSACDIGGRSPTPNGASSGGQPSSPKQKVCEYCGKTFRFMSNLIVHRRSHTGEKPYKCHICNHACTQASKLKRHMKTHNRPGGNQLGFGLDNDSGLSESASANNAGGNMANSNGVDYDDDEDEMDEEEECPEDEEEEEEPMDGGDNSRASSVEMVAEDLSGSTKRTPNRNGSPMKASRENNNNHGKEQGAGSGLKRSSQSLLGEVMDNIGLSDIQQYTEAYKQALEENRVGGLVDKAGLLGNIGSVLRNSNSSRADRVKQERPLSSNSHLSHQENGGVASLLNSRHLAEMAASGLSNPHLSELMGSLGQHNSALGLPGLGSFDPHNPFDPKRLKLADLAAERENPLAYGGFWPMGANPFAASLAQHLGELPGDLLRGGKSVSDSAFSKTSSASASNSPRPGPSLGRGGQTPPLALNARTSPSSGSATGTPPSTQRKEVGSRIRNDTCEFCGKVFKNCSNLTVHRRSHTGEKPYKCELCSYACAQSSKLTRHMKTHGRLGKDVYRCRFCDMPFSVPSTLEKHMRKCVVNQNSASPVSAAAIAAAASAVVSSAGQPLGLCFNTSNSNDRDSD